LELKNAKLFDLTVSIYKLDVWKVLRTAVMIPGGGGHEVEESGGGEEESGGVKWKRVEVLG
jgi:hypothetical protein